LVLSALMMLFWQLSGQPVLQLVYYASLLIPGVFLALGGQFAAALERLGRWHFAALCCGAGIVLLLPFAWPLHSGLFLRLQHHRLLWPAILGAAAVGLLAAKVRYTNALAILRVCGACSALSATTGTRTWGRPGEPDDPRFQKQAFLAVVDSVRAVQKIDPTDHLFFWYDLKTPLGPLHRSVASTFMWNQRLVSESFPLLGPKPETAYKLKVPPAHTRVAILTVDEEALQKAEHSLRQVGLTARFIVQRRISQGPISWNVIILIGPSQAALAAAVCVGLACARPL
jgi:hypothetical protein